MKKLLAGALLLLSASFSFAAVNPNAATQSELEAIKGIGPKKAQAIIEYRTKNGGFKSVEDLQNVHGIGHGKTFDKVKGEFTLSGQPSAPAIRKPGVTGNVKATTTPVTQGKKGFNNPAQQGNAKPTIGTPVPTTPPTTK